MSSATAAASARSTGSAAAAAASSRSAAALLRLAASTIALLIAAERLLPPRVSASSAFSASTSSRIEINLPGILPRSVIQMCYVPVSVANTIVTGPSFTSSSCIRAPNTPVATSTPSARSAAQNAS